MSPRTALPQPRPRPHPPRQWLLRSALLVTWVAAALYGAFNGLLPGALPGADAQPMQSAAGPADLVWSTFLGGTGGEDVYALALDADGAVYIGGETTSAGLATAGAHATRLGGGADGFVAKLAPGGDRLEWLTYLGGGARDVVTDLVVDRDGSVLIAGYTSSSDFPATAGAWAPSYGGDIDGFVARLDPTGSRLVAASFVGGRANDYAETVRLDDAGNVYVSGETWSPNLPVTPGAFQTVHAGASDMFVVRLDAALASPGFVTFLGGQGDDCADCSMDVSGDGQVTVVSRTTSRDMPISAGAFDPSHNGGTDAYVGRLAAGGAALVFGTYLGGSLGECQEGCYVAADADGTAVVVGNTSSADFPQVPAAAQPGIVNRDAFVARVSADGRALIASRRFGGRGSDVPRDLDLVSDGSILLVARTDSADFPVTQDGFDPTYNGAGDVVALRLDGATLATTYGTFLGGRSVDGGWRPRVLARGDAEVVAAGLTGSRDFPVTAGAFDTTFGGATDGFALVLAPGAATPTATIGPSATATDTATITPSATATDTATITPSATATDTATIKPSATATDTATIAPSATATGTATIAPSATASATATSSPSPTPDRYVAYLPLALTERCPPVGAYVDVVLVVDASTSMRELMPTGETKLEAATAAVRRFLGGLRLAPGQDRAALVAFNDAAWTLAPLTDDPAVLQAALAAVAIRTQSRLDLGIGRAAELLAASRRPNADPALVVLSDGRANPVPGSVGVEAARAARTAGVLTYAVGFGAVLDDAVLQGVAGAPDRHFEATTADALGAIFEQLTVHVPCGRARYWPTR